MKKNKIFPILLIAGTLGCAASIAEAAISTGGLSLIGFNADGNDDFAIAVFEDIAAGESIFFRDDEWDSGFSTGEAEMEWITPSLSAGTVVVFSSVGDGSLASASLGTLSFTRGSSMNLSGSGEAIWIYQGTSGAPTHFLSAFGTGINQFDGTEGSLTGTGLALGSTAIALPGNHPDGAAYNGPRTGLASFADYLPLVGDADTRWDFFVSDGTQALPFDTTSFTTAAIPEPRFAQVTLALSALLVFWRQRVRLHQR